MRKPLGCGMQVLSQCWWLPSRLTCRDTVRDTGDTVRSTQVFRLPTWL